MNKITGLENEELTKIKQSIKVRTSELSKEQLENMINGLLDEVLADPGNPLLRVKAQFAAEVWKGRYN